MLFGHPSFPGLLDKGNREAGEPTRVGQNNSRPCVSMTMSGALIFRLPNTNRRLAIQDTGLDKINQTTGDRDAENSSALRLQIRRVAQLVPPRVCCG